MAKRVTALALEAMKKSLDERERNFLTGYLCASESYRYRRPTNRVQVECEGMGLIMKMRER